MQLAVFGTKKEANVTIHGAWLLMLTTTILDIAS